MQLGTGDTPIKECAALIRDNKWPIMLILEREYRDAPGTAVEQTRWQSTTSGRCWRHDARVSGRAASGRGYRTSVKRVTSLWRCCGRGGACACARGGAVLPRTIRVCGSVIETGVTSVFPSMISSRSRTIPLTISRIGCATVVSGGIRVAGELNVIESDDGQIVQEPTSASLRRLNHANGHPVVEAEDGGGGLGLPQQVVTHGGTGADGEITLREQQFRCRPLRGRLCLGASQSVAAELDSPADR